MSVIRTEPKAVDPLDNSDIKNENMFLFLEYDPYVEETVETSQNKQKKKSYE